MTLLWPPYWISTWPPFWTYFALYLAYLYRYQLKSGVYTHILGSRKTLVKVKCWYFGRHLGFQNGCHFECIFLNISLTNKDVNYMQYFCIFNYSLFFSDVMPTFRSCRLMVTCRI